MVITSFSKKTQRTESKEINKPPIQAIENESRTKNIVQQDWRKVKKVEQNLHHDSIISKL